MVEHLWGEDNFDWDGLDFAIEYIGVNLKRWGRVAVRDYKEKWGCARIYCSFGFNSLHSITHPGHCFSRYPKWLWNIDCLYLSRIIPFLFNWWLVPYQTWLYRKLYSDMVKTFPHLKEEIVCCADYDELLIGL
jgi:hypothetical protein